MTTFGRISVTRTPPPVVRIMDPDVTPTPAGASGPGPNRTAGDGVHVGQGRPDVRRQALRTGLVQVVGVPEQLVGVVIGRAVDRDQPGAVAEVAGGVQVLLEPLLAARVG